MPLYPPGAVLIAAPSQVWSRGAAVTANAPVLSSDYGLAKLVDGSLSGATRFPFGTVQITVDLGQTRTPNLVGILNSNIDPGRVIGVTNEAGLARGFGARDPNCWLDLRGFPTTARYWTFAVNSNSIPVSLCEIVIATATVFSDGFSENAFEENLEFPGTRNLTEYLKQYVTKSGAVKRTASLASRLSEADRAALAAITDEVNVQGGRVVVVPDSGINDLWYVDWPLEDPTEYTNVAERRLTLPLTEQVGSVLNRA